MALPSPNRTAAVRAFSLTSRITQRDGRAGRGRAGQPHPRSGPPAAASRSPGCWISPGWCRSPRSPAVSGQPGRPRARPRASAASRHPGRSSRSPLRRDPRPASPSRMTGPCGVSTDEDASAATIRDDPVGGHERKMMSVHAVCSPRWILSVYGSRVVTVAAALFSK
jgi:hypothetical protein